MQRYETPIYHGISTQRSERIQTAGQSNNCARSHTTGDPNRTVGRQALFLPSV